MLKGLFEYNIADIAEKAAKHLKDYKTILENKYSDPSVQLSIIKTLTEIELLIDDCEKISLGID